MTDHTLSSEFAKPQNWGLWSLALCELSLACLSFDTFGLAATADFLIDQLAMANLIYFSLPSFEATRFYYAFRIKYNTVEKYRTGILEKDLRSGDMECSSREVQVWKIWDGAQAWQWRPPAIKKLTHGPIKKCRAGQNWICEQENTKIFSNTTKRHHIY